MNIVCCRCGVQPNHRLSNCIGSARCEMHCFCCEKPPAMRCIKCNAERDIPLSKHHNSCVGGKPHVFVYSEPWPPFPPVPSFHHTVNENQTPPPDSPNSSEAEMVVADRHSESWAYRDWETPKARDVVRTSPMEELSVTLVTSPQQDPTQSCVIVLDDEISSGCETPIEVKPERIIKNNIWVTRNDILKWKRCPRCLMKRKDRAGWLRHAQQCAQDPTIAEDSFFIYSHFKGWCNYLVRDCDWQRHSDPISGKCSICRSMRGNLVPIPFMPNPPPRHTDIKMASNRRIRRRKRRQKNQELSNTNQ
ncbi:hypothetical protein KR009_001693 [Drosophila setifemur]|nr:hypothetical protein KR009_001693 [Drosophila setifemur]